MQPPDVNKTEQKQIEAKGFKDFLEPPMKQESLDSQKKRRQLFFSKKQ